MIESLIAQGQAAMTAGEFADARDAFKDALQVDRENPLAARGLGFAYVALGKPVKALEPLEIAAQKPPLDRGLILAISAALVANHNSMRAVHFLLPYMQTHADPVDEPMLNALGTALTQAEGSAVKSQLFKDAAKLYRKQNTALEAAHEGKRRWGVTWLDKEDVDAKDADRAKVQQKVDVAYNRLTVAQNAEQSAEEALGQSVIAMGKRDENAIRNAQTNVATAKADLSKAQADYDEACKELASVPGPDFPPQIAVDAADLIVLPGAAAPVTHAPAVAANTDVSADVPKPEPAPATPQGDSKPAPAAPQGDSKPAPAPKNHRDQSVATPPDEAPKRPSVPKVASTRHLTRYAVGFAVAPDVLVTAASAVEDASSITVTLSDGKSMTATVLRAHHGDGLALLKVDRANLPCLALATSADASALTCFGFPEVDLFNPVPRSMDLSADAQGGSWKVRFTVSPRLPGGPILQNNAVVGVELGDRDSEPSTTPAATLTQLAALVADSANPANATPDPKKAIVQIAAER
jgi:tetratricopeptide (TPR) repeat protein